MVLHKGPSLLRLSEHLFAAVRDFVEFGFLLRRHIFLHTFELAVELREGIEECLRGHASGAGGELAVGIETFADFVAKRLVFA